MAGKAVKDERRGLKRIPMPEYRKPKKAPKKAPFKGHTKVGGSGVTKTKGKYGAGTSRSELIKKRKASPGVQKGKPNPRKKY